MFSLRNNDDDLGPFKAPLKKESDRYAIYGDNLDGPCFGRDDITIKDFNKSWANIGYTYQAPPGYPQDESNTKSLLAGSEYFTPSEVEVFYLN